MTNKFLETASRAKKWLANKNYPFSDIVPLETSRERFENQAWFGVEMPVINSLKVLEATIHWLEHYGVSCSRFNETKGSFLLPDAEIKAMLALCEEKGIGITFALSPRPEYDINAAFYRSKFGMEQCRRLNNNEAIAASLEEAIRLADLGCRGIIVYDIAVLSLLSEMRKEGLLPKDIWFKASSHCMATSPFVAKLLQAQGADSITVIHDTSLSMLQAMRKICPGLVLDVPIDTYADKGGFIRYNELAEIIQIGSPVFLKIGASAQNNPYDVVGDATVKTRVKRLAAAVDHIKRVLGETCFLPPPPRCSAIPQVKQVTETSV